jgi:hypothetical protein
MNACLERNVRSPVDLVESNKGNDSSAQFTTSSAPADAKLEMKSFHLQLFPTKLKIPVIFDSIILKVS